MYGWMMWKGKSPCTFHHVSNSFSCDTMMCVWIHCRICSHCCGEVGVTLLKASSKLTDFGFWDLLPQSPAPKMVVPSAPTASCNACCQSSH